MNIENLTLIRACKKADKTELQHVFRKIRDSGISKDDLNFVDQNGRTALSHLCSTALTAAVDVLLRCKGIDINKPDKDGNTPLHFAAETGQSDTITLMVSRSQNLVIDPKNSFGLTPLMKAAVQGRTDCAKRLILSNASLTLKDSRRGFTAKEWAHFCGRKFCADALGELMKKRKALQLLNGNQRTNLVHRGNTAAKSCIPIKVANSQKGETSLASKLRYIFNGPKLFSGNNLPIVMESAETIKQEPTVKLQPRNDLPDSNNITMKPIIKIDIDYDLPGVSHSKIMKSDEA